MSNHSIYGLGFNSISIIANESNQSQDEFFVGTFNKKNIDNNQIHKIRANQQNDSIQIECVDVLSHKYGQIYQMNSFANEKNKLLVVGSEKCNLFEIQNENENEKLNSKLNWNQEKENKIKQFGNIYLCIIIYLFFCNFKKFFSFFFLFF